MRKKLFIGLFSAATLLLFTFSMSSTGHAVGIFRGNPDSPCDVAANSTPSLCGPNDANNNSSQDPVYGVLKTVIDILSLVVGIGSVIVIIVQGLRMILSNGDSNTISSARNGIIYACVGVLIAILAQVIVAFVLTKFTT